jgi:anti-sigma regulatory factor (Ser/Thr protein kinase)
MEAASHNAPALLIIIAIALLGAIALVRRAPREPVITAATLLDFDDETLHKALLPAEPPVVDGLRLSWSYAPATPAYLGGGDFYDAFFLDDGTLAVTIGDAGGRGISAIVAMNTVRQAIRGALIDGARPSDALRRANRVLLRSDNPGIVTAIVGVIDPATLLFRYASAGHPLPLLASGDGTCTTVPGTGSGIALGVVPHHVTSEYVIAIPVDAMLALYTDGCTMIDNDSVAGTQMLADALIDTRALAPAKPAATIDRAIYGERKREDDASIVTIAPEPVLAHLDVRLPAEPASAPLARTAIRRFLASTPLGERRSFDAVVAAGEAVANVIEHAYDRRPHQTFVVRARYENQRCTILVEDSGTWHDAPPAAARGRGIALMRELSDHFDLQRTAMGTTVMLGFPTVANVADVSLALT